MKINDRIFLGAVSGLLGAIPGRLLNKAEFSLGLTDSRYEQMASSFFVGKRYANTPGSRNIGKITNGLLSVLIGIATTYTLSATGRDYAFLKAIGITSVSWIGLYGFSTNSRIARSKNPSVVLLSYLDHIVFGLTTAALVTKLGDEAIFPPS